MDPTVDETETIAFLPERELGQGARLFVKERGIQEIQRLRWNCACFPSGSAGVGVSSIEQGEEGMPTLALHHEVAAAFLCFIDRIERSVLAEFPRLLLRERVGLSGFQIDFTGDEQKAVANLLRAEASTDKAGQVAVVRIGLDQIHRSRARAAVGVRQHDEPVHRLQAVSVGDELSSQPVEQFRMTGRFPARTEVVRRAHQAPAEMPLPDAIHHDPRRQRMLCDPAAQFSPTALPQVGYFLTAEDREPAARRFLAQLFVVAPLVNAGVFPFGRGGVDHGIGDRDVRLRTRIGFRTVRRPSARFDQGRAQLRGGEMGELEGHSVDSRRMGVDHRTGNPDRPLQRAHPGDGNGTVSFRMHENRSGRKRGPDLHRPIG